MSKIVHCPTAELHDKVIEACFEKGIVWYCGGRNFKSQRRGDKDAYIQIDGSLSQGSVESLSAGERSAVISAAEYLGGKDVNKCDNRKCEYYDIGEDNHCEEWTNYDLCEYHGGGTIWPELEPKTTKENNMKENNTDSNVLAVFGSKVQGDELVVIDRHFTDNMLKEILMEKHHKAIQAACAEAEGKRLEAEKK